MITELHYDNTNTYLISGDKGTILFDTGWAGTLQRFFKELGDQAVRLSDIKYLLISHYHPDHMGIAQEIANQGVTILVMESQAGHLHDADKVFEKDKRSTFVPIVDGAVKRITFAESREFLQSLGVQGCVIPTPGHSDDSVSLILDEGAAFVGDLYPLYELEVHEEPEVKKSWDMILSFRPERIYYGHAKTAVLLKTEKQTGIQQSENVYPSEGKNSELYHTVKQIMRYIDKGMSIDKIASKLKIDREFVSDVCRMYLTHQKVGVQGILDRIEIKGR